MQENNQEKAEKQAQDKAENSQDVEQETEKAAGYLDFSLSDFADSLQLAQTLAYLKEQRYLENALTKARVRQNHREEIYDPDGLRCSFCYLPIEGKSFDRLTDGRIRCSSCSKTAIDHKEDFEKIVDQVLRRMELFYGVKLKKKTILRMADSQKVTEELGVKYVRGIRKFAGFARKHKRKNIVYVENGAPKISTMATIVHELTHAWQFENWKDRQINQFIKAKDKTLLPKMYLLLMEGMAVWSEIQYLYCIGEKEQAYYMDLAYSNSQEKNEYSLGFQLYKERYPLFPNGVLNGPIPFGSFPPLDYEVLERAARTMEPVS